MEVVVEDRSSDEYNPHLLQAVWDGYPCQQSEYPENQNAHISKIKIKIKIQAK